MMLRRLHFHLCFLLFINPYGTRLFTVASDLAAAAAAPLSSSADPHLKEPPLFVHEMPENIPGEPLMPSDMQHDGGGPKFRRALSGDGKDDVEIFKDIPEDGPKLAEMSFAGMNGRINHQVRNGYIKSDELPMEHRNFDPPAYEPKNLNSKQGMDGRLYMAPLSSSHRKNSHIRMKEVQGQHLQMPKSHRQPPKPKSLEEERSHYLVNKMSRPEMRELLKLEAASGASSRECQEMQQEALETLKRLQQNVTVLEMTLELTKMAREQAEGKYNVMFYDFVECQKRMSISNYFKNEILDQMHKLNDSVNLFRYESHECESRKSRIENGVDVLEGRLEETKLQLKTAFKKLEDMNGKMVRLDSEATSLREELSEKIDERDEAEFQLESLRSSLMSIQNKTAGNPGNDEGEEGEEGTAQLKSEDSLEALNEELVNQMGLMKGENERLKKVFESESEVLREELQECEDARVDAEDQTFYYNPLCSNGRIDAAFNLNASTVVIFQDEFFWVMSLEDDVATDEAQLINETFDRGPLKVDAALRHEVSDSVYLFSGDHYWHYVDNELLQGFPKFIFEGFPGVPNNIDAAFIWKTTGKVYIFKDDMYWQSEDDGSYKMYGIHSRQGGAHWHPGVPMKMDAAFDYDGSTIFTKKDLYYRYNDYSHKIEESVPPYPRLSCTWLFRCPSSSACAKKRRV